jgi:DNA-binding CsgD family transcriptional regulator
MAASDDPAEHIHALWDDMAGFEAAQQDLALKHLLSKLCAMVDAQNASWVCAVRLPVMVPNDPVNGWRPRLTNHLRPSPLLHAAVREQTRLVEDGNLDLSTLRNVSLAGQFRANRLIDLVPEEWFESDYYRAFYLGMGHGDAIWAGCPVNADAEVYFGLYRGVDRPRFTTAERDMAAAALRGLKWFHRNQLLSHGLLVAAAPLTAVERNVLQGLLGGEPEKQIASALGHSYHTTHEYVAAIYRKFGVNNRAMLMALWLGKAV